ncbi:hypothetical protein F2Q70_00003736 [Brassica cretica]|uniref:Uncharacterized protein n=1 Tax=Brassica cretica TaxID=69181 RepID=A0A8S9IN79_BRACR|nr:hypothetical protein F2Q70_00003736 [Brassica cretica]
MAFSFYKVAKSQVSNSKVWHSGCSALSRTVTRVAPLSGTVTQTVPRENLQIALCSVLFVPAGLSPIQCNFRPLCFHPLCGSVRSTPTGCSLSLGSSRLEQSAPVVPAAREEPVQQHLAELGWSAAFESSAVASIALLQRDHLDWRDHP